MECNVYLLTVNFIHVISSLSCHHQHVIIHEWVHVVCDIRWSTIFHCSYYVRIGPYNIIQIKCFEQTTVMLKREIHFLSDIITRCKKRKDEKNWSTWSVWASVNSRTARSSLYYAAFFDFIIVTPCRNGAYLVLTCIVSFHISYFQSMNNTHCIIWLIIFYTVRRSTL